MQKFISSKKGARGGEDSPAGQGVPEAPTSGPDKSESDLMRLAGLFAAHRGGAFSDEFAASLALEIVLHEIVEQIGLTTGATGAAIVLVSGEELVCRARYGVLMPALSGGLAGACGLAGECLRSQRIQRCDDLLTSTPADLESSARLGARSVMIAPLTREKKLVGLFQIFSSRPAAFGLRDEHTLQAFAAQVLGNLDRVSGYSKKIDGEDPVRPRREKYEPPLASEVSRWMVEAAAEPQAEKENIPFDQDFEPTSAEVKTWSGIDYLTLALAAVVLACTVVLGTLVELRMQGTTRSKASAPYRESTSLSVALPVLAENRPMPKGGKGTETNGSANSNLSPGGLQIYENGNVVFRLRPGSATRISGDEMQKASSIEKEPKASLENILVRRVEPEYPEEARRQGIQGAVVLDLKIGFDGAVSDVKMVSGPPLLSDSAIAAVKQWRFNSLTWKAQRAERETQVTITFRLPS